MAERTLAEIGKEIATLWKKPNYAAVPYLDAMKQMHGDCSTMFYADDGTTIVLYFLSNASGFRGDDAKRIEAELKKMAGVK